MFAKKAGVYIVRKANHLNFDCNFLKNHTMVSLYDAHFSQASSLCFKIKMHISVEGEAHAKKKYNFEKKERKRWNDSFE